MKNIKKRILTGDNPTGKLHVGHLVGSLENRVSLQSKYETFIILADTHALAYPKYVKSADEVGQSTLEVAMDNLAVGLDPEKVTIFAESSVPEIYEIAVIFSMLVSHNRALRNPTLKEEIREKDLGDSYSLGFVNFPILQAADILSVQAELVPVGEDQLPHIEQTNEIGKKFNSYYGRVFSEVEGRVGRVKRLVGTDGNAKMSKSLGNCIYLSDSRKEIEKKVMGMYTDPNRIHPSDPGTVEGNPVFLYHDAFNLDTKEVDDFKQRYKEGRVGDVEVKKRLVEVISTTLEPIRNRREEYENDPDKVKDILKQGAERTRCVAIETLKLMRKAMKFSQ